MIKETLSTSQRRGAIRLASAVLAGVTIATASGCTMAQPEEASKAIVCEQIRVTPEPTGYIFNLLWEQFDGPRANLMQFGYTDGSSENTLELSEATMGPQVLPLPSVEEAPTLRVYAKVIDELGGAALCPSVLVR